MTEGKKKKVRFNSNSQSLFRTFEARNHLMKIKANNQLNQKGLLIHILSQKRKHMIHIHPNVPFQGDKRKTKYLK